MRQPSIKDVAARCGVSFQTVSKVLNGGGSVAPSTRESIQRAAGELGYLPDASARGLVTQRTRLLGVVVGDLADEIVTRFVVAAEREAARQGYALAVVSLDHAEAERGAEGFSQAEGEVDRDEHGVHERSLRALRERRVDGILLAAPQLERDARLGALLTDGPPVVGLHTVVGTVATLVGSDHEEVGALATRHLVEHGHRRIGVVAGPSSRRVSHARMRGHRAVMEAAGLDSPAALVETGDWSPESGFAATHRLLAREPHVSAVVVHSDLMAVGALHAAHQLGRHGPDRLAVVGVDDIPVAAHTVPPLTTVRVPFDKTGQVAASCLIDLVEGRSVPSRQIVPVSLAVRASCGCREPDPEDPHAVPTAR
ncbi:MAG TPA: LacI family DNA-binding transcriptional regulator [Ornithinimicrobium sp.]|uniref:LacI family DNA-binding transcriptional regulator n=1 Tax=Ornithinimicrobium sp. TaxID=1977084 RepID=UPI002B48A452|nr:LacI family DNA-binding transcriptional regulator [Ornithinimicrobium sp.]HKJ11696.1 LacI family DNA-binding transcriptional regulator [Ornithinimicrobium sp.]